MFEIDIAVIDTAPSVFTVPLEEKRIHFRALEGKKAGFRANHKAFQALMLNRQYDVVHLNIFHAVSLYYAKAAQKCVK